MRRETRSAARSCIWIATGALALAAATAARAATAFDTVAVSGQPAPGTPAGVTFGGFSASTSAMTVNASGQVIFRAPLTGAGVTTADDTGVWLGAAGAVQRVAREGDPTPATPAVLFGEAGAVPLINNASQFYFRSGLAGANLAADTALWHGTPNSLTSSFREGDPAPGLPGGILFDNVGFPVTVNAHGQTVMTTLLQSTSGPIPANESLWLVSPAGPQLVAREDDPAAGEAGGAYGSIVATPALNDAGQVAFIGRVRPAGSFFPGDDALWAGAPGALQQVARENAPAPGMPAGVTFSALFPPTSTGLGFNAAGHVAFPAGITGAGVTAADDSGIWTGAAGTLQLVAREGDAAPGAADAARFGELFAATTRVNVNNADGLAFLAPLAGPTITSGNDRGIWAGSAAALRLIAREGDAAPGAGAGIVFEQLAEPLLSDAGELVIRASVRGDGVTTANDVGLWIGGIENGLQLLLREGDLFDVDLGASLDVRTVASIDRYAVAEADAGGFTKLAVSLSFTDGSSGIFVTSVPEPSVAGVFAVAAVAFAIARRVPRIAPRCR